MTSHPHLVMKAAEYVFVNECVYVHEWGVRTTTAGEEEKKR